MSHQQSCNGILIVLTVLLNDTALFVNVSFRDLRMRFEAPNEQNRWDSPLFRVAAIDEGQCR